MNKQANRQHWTLFSFCREPFYIYSCSRLFNKLKKQEMFELEQKYKIIEAKCQTQNIKYLYIYNAAHWHTIQIPFCQNKYISQKETNKNCLIIIVVWMLSLRNQKYFAKRVTIF